MSRFNSSPLTAHYSLNFVQLRQQFFVIGNSFLVLFAIANHALFIDDENRPLGEPFGPETVVQGTDRPVRIEICEHGEVDPAHLLGKSLVRKNRVNAYAQHLSVPGLEVFAVGLEVRQLLLSAAGEVQGIESQHHILLAHEIL